MPAIFTIGHSTRAAGEFANLLAEHGVRQVADVRRFPGSKRYPHFSAESMAPWLGAVGIAYVHLPELGGRRTPSAAASPNTFWRSASFRAYADYMATDEFRAALARLEELARQQPTAIMCSEAVPWRCHRQLIADALATALWQVTDIIGPGSSRPHAVNPHAQPQPDGTLIYRAEQQELFSDP